MLATLVPGLMPTFDPFPAAVPLTSPFGPGDLVARAVALLAADFLVLRSCPSPEEIRRRGVAGPEAKRAGGFAPADGAARRRCVRHVCPIIAFRSGAFATRVAVSPVMPASLLDRCGAAAGPWGAGRCRANRDANGAMRVGTLGRGPPAASGGPRAAPPSHANVPLAL